MNNYYLTPLVEYIELSEVLHPLSASYESVKAELKRHKEKEILRLLELRAEIDPDLKTDKTLKFDFPKKYNEASIGQIRRAWMKKEQTSHFLWHVSNDVRPYEFWVKALDKQLKVYSNIAPVPVRQVGTVYYFPGEVFDMFMMGMSGKLFTHFDLYRAKMMVRMSKETGRDLLTEFFLEMEAEEKLKEQAEKEWKEAT